MSTFSPFQKIAIAKEKESPENPGCLEKRVALVPSDAKKLTQLLPAVYGTLGSAIQHSTWLELTSAAGSSSME